MKFTKGNRMSKGRPPGKKNSQQYYVRKIGEEKNDHLLEKVYEQSMGGDMIAARIILNRTDPEPKGRFIDIEFPKIKDLDTLEEAMDCVLLAITGKKITITEASELMNVLERRWNAKQANITQALIEINARLDNIDGG